MTNNIDKTIPYQPSAADLENLRRLRSRMKPSACDQDVVEKEKIPGEVDTQDSHANCLTQKSEKNIP